MTQHTNVKVTAALTEPSDDDAASDTQILLAAIIENTSSDQITFGAMTSHIFDWTVEDADGKRYNSAPMSLQAPHYISVLPGKALTPTLPLRTPAMVQAEYNDLDILSDTRVVTDPDEIHAQTSDDGVEFDVEGMDGEERPVFEPAVPVDLDKELTVTFTVKNKTHDETITETTTFTPSALTRVVTNSDELVPDAVEIDTGATVNITDGRSDTDTSPTTF